MHRRRGGPESHLREQHDNVEELRALTMACYDRLQAAFWPLVIQDKDKKAADVVLWMKASAVHSPARRGHVGGQGAPRYRRTIGSASAAWNSR